MGKSEVSCMDIGGLFSGQSLMQIRVEETGSLHKVAIYSKYAYIQAVHILSTNILVVIQGYRFNVK